MGEMEWVVAQAMVLHTQEENFMGKRYGGGGGKAGGGEGWGMEWRRSLLAHADDCVGETDVAR